MPKPSHAGGGKPPKPSKPESRNEQMEARVIAANDLAQQETLLADGFSFDGALDVAGEVWFIFSRDDGIGPRNHICRIHQPEVERQCG